MLTGVALFGALIYLSGPGLVLAELAAVGVLGFLAVVGNVVCFMLTWSISWYILLRGAGIVVPWWRTLSPMLAGYAVTYITPSMFLGGEPVRAYWVAKEAQVPMARVMATAVVERLLAGISLLAFASIGGFFAIISPRISLADKQAVGLGLGSVAVFLLLGVVSFARNYRWLSRILRVMARLFPRRRGLQRAADTVAETETTMHLAFTRKLGYTSLAFLFQLLTVFLNYLRPQIFFYFTQKALFTFPQLSLFFTLNMFLNAFLWLTPGGFGLTDGGRLGIFTLLGIPPSSAVAFNVVYRFVEVVLVGVGVHLLLQRGLFRLSRGRVEVQVDREATGRYDPPSGGDGRD